MRVLFDVNVLIALFDAGHVHHNRAHRWWAHNQESGWATCPLTETGFVHVLSQPHYPNKVSPAVAIEFLTTALHTSGHEFWPDDVSFAEQGRFAVGRILGPKQLADLYLLALAVRRGGRMATFDKRVPLSAVVGATAQNLVLV